MSPSKIYVPLAALSLPGQDGGAATPPAAGDEVDITEAKAVVKSIDGDNACIELTSVNGQPVENAEAKEPSLDDEESELRNEAQSSQAGGKSQSVY